MIDPYRHLGAEFSIHESQVGQTILKFKIANAVSKTTSDLAENLDTVV